jgi:hypothetical protein
LKLDFKLEKGKVSFINGVNAKLFLRRIELCEKQSLNMATPFLGFLNVFTIIINIPKLNYYKIIVYMKALFEDYI